MSFRCGKCKQAIGPVLKPRKDRDGNTILESVPPKPVRVVVETRQRQYPERHTKTRRRSINDPGGFGQEIVREINCCAACA